MNWPIYNFNDPDLDYSQVELTNKRMYSYLNTQVACCKGKSLTEQLWTVNRLMLAADIDGDTDPDLYNEDRWKADVKAAYLLLYKLV